MNLKIFLKTVKDFSDHIFVSFAGDKCGKEGNHVSSEYMIFDVDSVIKEFDQQRYL